MAVDQGACVERGEEDSRIEEDKPSGFMKRPLYRNHKGLMDCMG